MSGDAGRGAGTGAASHTGYGQRVVGDGFLESLTESSEHTQLNQ